MRINSALPLFRRHEFSEAKRPSIARTGFGARACTSTMGYLRVKRKKELKLKIRLRYRTLDVQTFSFASHRLHTKGYLHLSAEYGYDFV